MGACRAIGPVGIVLLAVLALGGAAAVGATSGGPAGPAQQTIDADTVSLRVDLGADGSATWQVTYRIELDDRNATAAFESLQSDIEADPGPYLDRFDSRMQRAMSSAENATGREMSIGDSAVEASVESLPQGEYGVVTYRLEWTNFAVVDGERLRAGDAIDELFLDAQTSLTIAWPEGYSLVSHEPSATTADNGSVTWQGRRDFGAGEPRVEVVRGPAGGEAPGASGLPLLPIGLVLVVILVAGGWAYYRREGRSMGEGDVGGSVAAGAESPADGTDGPPPELLSNEERVLQILEQHGGRVKQQQVADELEWTDAKTSQVVSDLREDGELESFRLGRENVLTLPDVSIEPEPDEAEGGDESEEGADQ